MQNNRSCPDPYNQPITKYDTSGTTDFGPDPFVTNIRCDTLNNNFFRRTLWTGTHMQLTLMSINPGDDIGFEIHPDVDQFLRIEQGQGIVMMGTNQNDLNYQRRVSSGHSIIVPAGTYHDILNTGNVPLKMYSIYAPPKHPSGTVHMTKQDAEKEKT